MPTLYPYETAVHTFNLDVDDITGIILRIPDSIVDETGVTLLHSNITMSVNDDSFLAEENELDKLDKRDYHQSDLLVDEIEGYLIIRRDHDVVFDREEVKQEITRIQPTGRDNIHQFLMIRGGILVIPTATGDDFSTVVNHIHDALSNSRVMIIRNGSLLLFLDSADLSDEFVTQVRKNRAWRRNQFLDLSRAKEAMKKRGHGFHNIDRPHGEDGDVKFWLNGKRIDIEGLGSGYPAGWYTVDELVEGKYYDDLVETLKKN